MKTNINSKSASKGTSLNKADFARARLAGIFGLLPIAALVSILASCASVDSTSARYVGAPHYAPSDPASVQILRAQPTQPHERLGELVIDASTDPAPPVSELEDKVRREAAKIGADAAVITVDRIQPEGAYVTGGNWNFAGGYWNQTVEPILGRKIVAVAIKYQPNQQLTPTGR